MKNPRKIISGIEVEGFLCDGRLHINSFGGVKHVGIAIHTPKGSETIGWLPLALWEASPDKQS